MTNEYSLVGKSIGVYTTRGNKRYKPDDISDFLKRFQLHETLRLIGTLSHNLFFMKPALDHRIEGVPISNAILAYVAMKAVESANDYKKLIITKSDLAKTADMYWGLEDPIETDAEAEACLLRFGSSQLDYQRRLQNLLPRALCLYKNLWTTVPGTVPIDSVVKSISGLNIEEMLLFTFAFTGQSSKRGGFFRLYTEVDSKDSDIIALFNATKQQAFVDWLSYNYKAFRVEAREGLSTLPSPIYERQRFNPLIKHPILIPDDNPLRGAPQVYLVPIPRLVHERVTRGLYFELSDHFSGPGKQNSFRQSFGYVFQEYVGELLKDAVGAAKVLPEFKYNDVKGEKLTPDWMVIDGDVCLLVEVKQSGLYLPAKMWGEIETVKQDLAKTVCGGVRQLWSFEQAVRSGNHTELAFLSGIREFQRVVISNDHLYFANSILKDKIWENFQADELNIPHDYHWHILSIDDLESVLGIHGDGVLRVLAEKHRNKDDDELDFGDYLAKYYADRNPANAYLERIQQAFFSRFNS